MFTIASTPMPVKPIMLRTPETSSSDQVHTIESLPDARLEMAHRETTWKSMWPMMSPAASEQRERLFGNGPAGQPGQGLSALDRRIAVTLFGSDRLPLHMSGRL
jgi:hypothetical protein